MGLRLALACAWLAGWTPLCNGDPGSSAYFPLRVGNWWTYEEQDADGHTLARETWRVVDADARSRSGEFHLRSRSKRLDGLGHTGHRFEREEYLRVGADGLRKRWPAGHDTELEVLLVQDPPRHGTRWRDAQGSCEVTERVDCAGPRGRLDDCLVVVCTLGDPPLTIVTSTYARDVGMVRQEVDVRQLVPVMDGPAALDSSAARQDGHSVLRLTGYNVR